MNYLELIRGFWRLNEEYSFTPTEISLYFYLVETCNICQWKNPFRRNNSKVCADLNITYNTLKRARKKLIKHNLIEVLSANGSANVIYTLSKFDEVSDEVVHEGGKITPEIDQPCENLTRFCPIKDKLNLLDINKDTPPLPPASGGSVSVPSEKFLNFQKWIKDNAPNVARMKEPFTEREYDEIFKTWKRDEILDILREMHNYKPLCKKNVSAYLTANNWLNRRKENEKTTDPKPPTTYVHD